MKIFSLKYDDEGILDVLVTLDNGTRLYLI